MAEMTIVRDLATYVPPANGTAVTIGAYDGVHLGHQAVLREHLLEIAADVGRPAREQMVEDGAQRIDVGARVDLLAARLLRRHVARRAQRGARV